MDHWVYATVSTLSAVDGRGTSGTAFIILKPPRHIPVVCSPDSAFSLRINAMDLEASTYDILSVTSYFNIWEAQEIIEAIEKLVIIKKQERNIWKIFRIDLSYNIRWWDYFINSVSLDCMIILSSIVGILGKSKRRKNNSGSQTIVPRRDCPKEVNDLPGYTVYPCFSMPDPITNQAQDPRNHPRRWITG